MFGYSFSLHIYQFNYESLNTAYVNKLYILLNRDPKYALCKSIYSITAVRPTWLLKHITMYSLDLLNHLSTMYTESTNSLYFISLIP